MQEIKIKSSAVMWSIFGSSIISSICTAATLIFMVSIFHVRTVQNTKIINSIDKLQIQKISSEEASAEFKQVNDRLTSLVDLSTEIRERQIINEANIEINHKMIKDVVGTLPTTKPIKLPNTIGLPPREK